MITATAKASGYENSWHWVRDVALGEDAHLHQHRNGVQVLSILRTAAL